jgi:hypothetical protein
MALEALEQIERSIGQGMVLSSCAMGAEARLITVSLFDQIPAFRTERPDRILYRRDALSRAHASLCSGNSAGNADRQYGDS